jgi:hypothetical protein
MSQSWSGQPEWEGSPESPPQQQVDPPAGIPKLPPLNDAGSTVGKRSRDMKIRQFMKEYETV